MKRLFVLLAVLLASPVLAADKEAPVVPPRQGKSEKLELFNGKNLDGWEGHADLWSVQDGVIVGKNTKEVKVSTYLLTKRKFTDFHLKFSAKLVESEMHSGVALWGRIAPEQKDPYTYAGHLVMFPSGWGLWDLYGRAGGPAMRVDTQPEKKAGKQHEWNDMEIFAQGNRIRLVVNGVLVLDWRDPEPDAHQGGAAGPATALQQGAPGSSLQGPGADHLPERQTPGRQEGRRQDRPAREISFRVCLNSRLRLSGADGCAKPQAALGAHHLKLYCT